MTHILFVDPFSSTEFLASRLRQENIKVSALITFNRSKSDYFALKPELFDNLFYLRDAKNLSELIESLSKLNIERIYTGSEMSLEIADQLSDHLGLAFANSPTTSLHRSNKFHTQEILYKAGFPVIKQILINHHLTHEQENDLKNWDCAYIIKPVNSAGAVGVVKCESVSDIKNYLKQAFHVNLFGQSIDSYIVQEYLVGEEYFVDMFSEHGKHYLSGVQHYCRSLYQNSPICLYTEIIQAVDPIALECVQYVESILTQIGLLNGFSHTEIMMTAKGPYLIEVNPRISGGHGSNNKLFEKCNIPSQVDLLISSCNNNILPKKTALYGKKVILYHYQKNKIKSLNMELLSTLNSFAEAIPLKKPGTFVSPPKDLTDAVAFVLLAHSDKNKLLADYHQLQQWNLSQQLF